MIELEGEARLETTRAGESVFMSIALPDGTRCTIELTPEGAVEQAKILLKYARIPCTIFVPAEET